MSISAVVAEKVWEGIQSTHSVNDDQLSILHFLFGKNFERATRIVDQRGVKRILGKPSGRSIFKVVGESKRKEEYLCFPEHYCACYSFFYDIVNRGEQLSCKHQLAVRLASSLGACVDFTISDDELALMLSQL
ncbi:uncharacterized protein LOC107784698 [Nicotiana tabacum]|uniref:Uncharacterized protein LOC107784698 n=2 Tax=Nicotiana TaxID=4085 RepID=A0A1S3ZA63_TOBAC|nr:PREDICTED: zinc finger SWIM domain-containing protein 7 [Nicotiana sylvestris]XP_009787465.1 PREDICTED: zinc finger SWIM domain-containing protein 7 [Nicotiana sylvestris]XP_016461345.1 PREDICTED: zinc finger SWIM domain-containing protein 7-like [Nicotiana tabacum]